jgi:hypothetical protein
MNNIISKVAASILVAGVVVSISSANDHEISSDGSLLVTDSNFTVEHAKDDLTGKTFPIDMKMDEKPVNMTFRPVVNATPGSGFTLKFENGGFKKADSIFLCTNAEGNSSKKDSNMTVVGNMFSRGQSGTIISGIMTAPQFQFNNEVNTSLIKKGRLIYFRTNDSCLNRETKNGKTISYIPDVVGIGEPCQVVTAQIIDGKTTQGTSFPDYNTPIRSLGKTIKAVKIACATPICYIDAAADLKKFTAKVRPSGINKMVDKLLSDVKIAKSNDYLDSNAISVASCPNCPVVDCISTIQISNSTSHAIRKMDLAFDFYDKDGKVNNKILKLKKAIISVGGEEPSDKKVYKKDYQIDGKKLTIKNLSIANGSTTLQVKLIANQKDVLPIGLLKARINGLDTTPTSSSSDVNYDEVKNIAVLKISGQTKFVVPYMNTKYRTFVKITSQDDKEVTKLSAVITDQNGKSTEVKLDDLKPSATVYLFSDHGKLYEAAQAAGLKNAWTVEFTSTSVVTVDAYMKSPNGGDRRIEAFD